MQGCRMDTHKGGFSQGELLVERMCVCVCYRLHLAGHADLQYAEAEEPWELSGWELVLDCALSELLSKLFPDNMHTHIKHKMRGNAKKAAHIAHKNTTEMSQRGMMGRAKRVWDDMERADKCKMINPVNLFSLWGITATFQWQSSVTRSHWKRKKTFSSLSQLMAPLQQDLQLWLLLNVRFCWDFNGSLASEQRMDDDNTDGHDNERELDVTHYRSSV